VFVVTNRRIEPDAGGLEIFGHEPNPRGPNELRLVEVTGTRRLRARLLKDELPKTRVREIARDLEIALDADETWYQSLDVAARLFLEAQRSRKQVLVFVHGYNNDVEDVLATAREIERRYAVLVLPFTWPADGGGPVSGTAKYLGDKRDARASTGALDRVFEKVRAYHELFTATRSARLWERAHEEFPGNHEAARAEYVRLQERACKVKINLLCHSMGNYVMKHATIPSGARSRTVIFDNVGLVAADTNNQGHASWVEAIEARGAVYVVINEDDFALKWSRRKPGEEQLARLGHFVRGLDARDAVYLDVTRAAHVGDDHSYFVGKPVERNERLAAIFSDLFEGRRAEDRVRRRYRADLNAYDVR